MCITIFTPSSSAMRSSILSISACVSTKLAQDLLRREPKRKYGQARNHAHAAHGHLSHPNRQQQGLNLFDQLGVS